MNVPNIETRYSLPDPFSDAQFLNKYLSRKPDHLEEVSLCNRYFYRKNRRENFQNKFALSEINDGNVLKIMTR